MAEGGYGVARIVHAQLTEDFPEKACEWVLDPRVRWEGPLDVPIQHVDFDNVHSWHAFHDAPKVQKFEKKIRKGKLKPAILVDRPHKTNLMVVDGHHRALASRRVGQTLRSYVAHVPDERGPWDEMHSSQNRLQPAQGGQAKLKDGNKSPSDLRTAAVVVIDDGQGHVLVTTRDGDKNDLDLPGGRLEPGESPEAAAKRETFEETGVTVTRLVQLYAGAGSDDRRHVTIYRAIEHDANKLEKFKPEKGEDVGWADPRKLAGPKCTFGPFTRDHFAQLFGHLDPPSAVAAKDVAAVAKDLELAGVAAHEAIALAEGAVAAGQPKLAPGEVKALAAHMAEHFDQKGFAWQVSPQLAALTDAAKAPGYDVAEGKFSDPATFKIGVAKMPTDATIPPPPGWVNELRRGLAGKVTMPFVSEAQRSYLEIHHPDVAEEFARHTPEGAKLPKHVKSVTADIGPSAVHVDGLSGGYRLQTAEEKGAKVPDLAGAVPPPFQQPKPPPGTDVTSPTHVPRWPLADNVNMISAAKRRSLPGDKFALPELKKYPIDTPARVRNAAARLEQNRSRLSPADYKKARGAIARAAKKFGIHSQYNEDRAASEAAPATHVLVPHMRVEATIPHGGSLHVRHLSEDRRAVLSLDDPDGGDYFSTVTLADAPEDGPVWNQVACVGAFKGHPAGPFELNAKVFDEIVQNWERTGRKPIPVDYEHASEADATSGTIPIHGAPAQGWITDLKNHGAGGLYGKFEWLPQARAQIRGGQYKFLSPAIRFESRDKVTGRPIGARLTSAALTNQPFLDNLAPVQAKAMAKDLIAARDDAATTAKPAPQPAEHAVLMQSMLERDAKHFITPPHEYMPKLKAAMGLHPFATAEAMKDHLDRLRDHVGKAGGNLGALVDGVQLANFVQPLRDLTMGEGGGASTTVEQILDAVEEMIDAAMLQHIAIDHPGEAPGVDAVGYSMATAVESDKGTAAPMAGYADAPAAMADKQGEADMTAIAEKEAEITRLQLQLSDKESEVTKLKTENQALTSWKAEREAKDLEAEVAFVMSAHADKIAHLPGDENAKKALLLKALKESPEFFRSQYPKNADPSTQYLLATQTPAAPSAGGGAVPELEAILLRGEDVRATTARLRDEKKLSYLDAAQQALRLHQLARQLAG